MISLIPYRHILINSSLSPEKAASILSSALGQRRSRRSLLRWFQAQFEGFKGTVPDDGFEIMSIYPAWSDENYITVAYGKYKSQQQGIQINVHIMPHPLTAIALVIIFLVGLFYLIPYLEQWIETGRPDKRLFYILLIIFSGYGLMIVIFNNEADKVSDFIHRIYAKYRKPGI